MKTVVEIIPKVDQKEYLVNGHLVHKDRFNNWTCKVDLSTKEMAAFKRYEKKVINNPQFTKHTKATYNM